MLKAITVAKNEEKSIGSCIFSVLNQTYHVSEYFILDDYSNDRTSEIVSKFNTKRIKLIHAKDLGIPEQPRQHGSRIHLLQNRLIETSGDWEYLLNVDADTILPFDYCEKIINLMKNDKYLVLAGSNLLITPKKTEVTTDTHVRGSNYIVKRWFFDLFKQRGFSLENPFGEVLLERFAFASNLKVKSIPLNVIETRDTGVTSIGYFFDGICLYILGSPFLTMLLSLRKFEKRNLKLFLGWLSAFICRKKQLFTSEELRNIRRFYYKRIINALMHQTP